MKNSVLRRGGWRMLICIALLAAVVVSGVLFDLTGGALRFDLTKDGVFTLSDTTLDLLAGLQQDINIYSVYGETTDSRLTELLARYAAASERVSANLITADQVAYFTSAELPENSLIVAGNQYVDTLEYTELYTMEYEVQDYYQTLTGYYLVAEDKINKAIANVTADLPIAYLMSEHGEAVPEAGLLDRITEAGCHTKRVYLSELSAVPEDCAMIICNAPQVDITEAEADLLISYIDGGGSFFLVTDMRYGVGEQLSRVTEHVGLVCAPGIVMEGDMAYMFGSDYAYYLVPDFASESSLAAEILPGLADTDRVLIGLAHAIDIAQGTSYHPEALLTTSDSAYLKPNAYVDGVIEYVDGDRIGPLCVAATSEKAGAGKVVWLASSQCMGDMIDEMIGGTNYVTAAAALGWLHESDAETGVEDVERRSVLTPSIQMTNPGLFIGVSIAVPVVLFLIGVILCAKRHKAKVPNTAE
ncbi:MAG: Gldg family protein [Clostridia bacterium]|nr:Gldg family protein [Clostridia bacterium]